MNVYHAPTDTHAKFNVWELKYDNQDITISACHAGVYGLQVKCEDDLQMVPPPPPGIPMPPMDGESHPPGPPPPPPKEIMHLVPTK